MDYIVVGDIVEEDIAEGDIAEEDIVEGDIVVEEDIAEGDIVAVEDIALNLLEASFVGLEFSWLLSFVSLNTFFLIQKHIQQR